ncbi:unnamed protein product [Phytomonas sp. Hart1]|nr:unnamed protein product [Phytomonas sp. Hart1]|eukprot:CCW66838.1 unnamed protein product [Phytomonas sp. isolate Hart1]
MPSGPKSNKYSNRHSEEARKCEQERLLEFKKAQEAAQEDAKWTSNAKVPKRMEKQREQERKAEEKSIRDAEKREQLSMEEAEHSKGKLPAHIQKRELQKNLSKALAAYDKERDLVRGSINQTKANATHDTNNIELTMSNKNHQAKVESSEDPALIASSKTVGAMLKSPRSQQQAIPENRHIGKRSKTLYKTFYKEQFEKVKSEQPNLRLAQYNDIIWKIWQKSLLNPFVLRSEARDQARLDANRKWLEGDDSDEEDEDTSEAK